MTTRDAMPIMRRAAAMPAARGVTASDPFGCSLCHTACNAISDPVLRQACHLACNVSGVCP
jgi:hypothetical protein